MSNFHDEITRHWQLKGYKLKPITGVLPSPFNYSFLSTEKDSVLAMVRALSNINPGDIDRPRTSSGPVEYEQNFLYHESSLSPEGKNYF